MSMNKYWSSRSKGFVVEVITIAELQPDGEEIVLYRRITGGKRKPQALRSEVFFKRYMPIKTSLVESFVGARIMGGELPIE